MDCKQVTVLGRVRTVDVEQHATAPILHLDVNMAGGMIEVYQPVSGHRRTDDFAVRGPE